MSGYETEICYCDVLPEEFRNNLNEKVNSWTFLHLNIRSFQKNYDGLMLLLAELRTSFKVIALTECWFQQGVEVMIPGYKTVKSGVSRNKAGGAVLLVSAELDIDVLEFDAKDACDSVIAVISSKDSRKYRLAIACIYRSPSNNISDFLAILPGLSTCLEKQNSDIILLGDMNINVSNTCNADVIQLLSVAAEVGLMQLIHTSTRIAKYSSSIIDLIFTNIQPDLLQAGNIFCTVTDHNAVYVNVSGIGSDIDEGNNIDEGDNAKGVNKIRYNYEKIKIGLKEVDWQEVLKCDSINVQVENLIGEINRIVKNNAGCKKSYGYYSYKNKSWVTNGILRAIRKRNKM